MSKKWKPPHEIQNYPHAAGQRFQLRHRNGRVSIKLGAKVDWAEVIEWRWA